MNERLEGSLRGNLLIRVKDAGPWAEPGLRNFLFKYGVCGSVRRDGPDIEALCGVAQGSGARSGMLLISRGPFGATGAVFGLAGTEAACASAILAALYPEQASQASLQGGELPLAEVTDGAITTSVDLFDAIGRMLCGQTEMLLTKTGDRKGELARVPLVDAIERVLWKAVADAVHAAGCDLAHRPFWPEGKSFALCLTHDVDRCFKTFQYFPSMLRALRSADVAGAARQTGRLLFMKGVRNPYWSFKRIKDLETQLGVRSTFFFLNESGRISPFDWRTWVLYGGRYRIRDPRVVQVMKDLRESGFEIGVHGSYRSYLDTRLLKEEKQELESILGGSVVGVRQHYLIHADGTASVQEACGFHYDATLGFPGLPGFRRGACYPFQLFDSAAMKQTDLVEIPMSIMDGSLRHEADPSPKALDILDTVARNNGVLTLLWHETTMGMGESPRVQELYGRLIQCALDKGAWAATCSQIRDWTVKRMEAVR